ncbi:hypothetical protein DAH66_12685 [Sphingomonas koreensis]|uniref:Uncharacterized protein n=1 Tax=Sphingomonas koreensis TaxID=93064 RepID=A0A430G2C7_9SPHN|nr:hypothetical protein [Sphingomonas koreensis]RSY83119.1 hypothetical protein DAH66_12685 [Sphingomonas koreensis]
MTTMILDRKRFINGRLAQEGEEIDLDEEGGFMPAGSTPVDQMSIERLETILKRRKKEADASGDKVETKAPKPTAVKAPKPAASKAPARGGKAKASEKPTAPPAGGDDLTLEGKTIEQLREIAGREDVEIGDDADVPAIIEAINAKRDDV